MLNKYNIKYIGLIRRMFKEISFYGLFDGAEFLGGDVVEEIIHIIHDLHFHEGQKFIIFKNQIQFSSVDCVFFL